MNNAALSKPYRIAVLVSGNGSNLQALIDNAPQAGYQIVGVISNKACAYAITRANNAGIPTAVLSHNPNGTPMKIATFETHALHLFAQWNVDLVVLAGFMRIISSQFIAHAPPMINLHPSLLPLYKGLDTHERVLQTGDRQHGCSVHIVTPELDSGQVLAQMVLDVLPNDTPETLRQRVHKAEHKLLPLVVALFSSRLWHIRHNQVQSHTITTPLKLIC